MLSSPKKDFENYRPFDFLDFLFKENLVDNMNYIQKVEKYDYMIHNNPLSHYFYLLNIIQSINNNSNHNVHKNDCIIWLKRIWNEFFRDINTNYDLDFYNKSLRVLLYKFENYFIETETKLLQYNNLSIIDKTIQKNEFIEKLIVDKDIITSWINEITISKNKKNQKLPLLKTHPCILCDVVEQKQKTDYFTIEFLYSLKSIINNEKLNNIDFFYEKTHCLII